MSRREFEPRDWSSPDSLSAEDDSARLQHMITTTESRLAELAAGDSADRTLLDTRLRALYSLLSELDTDTRTPNIP